jgi:hypothetical protein
MARLRTRLLSLQEEFERLVPDEVEDEAPRAEPAAPETHEWLGDDPNAGPARLRVPLKLRILNALRTAPSGTLTLSDLSHGIQISMPTASSILARLITDGRVEKVGRGMFRFVPQDERSGATSVGHTLPAKEDAM